MWKLILITLLGLSGLICCAESQDDLSELLLRLRDSSSSHMTEVQADEAAFFCTSLQHDGSWNDLDYQSRNRSDWQTAKHLMRTRQMARLLVTHERKGPSDEVLTEAVCRAVNYWSRNQFLSSNWWYNEINIPELMVDILILCPSAKTPRALAVVEQAKFGRTGQNRVWLAGIRLQLGILLRDEQLIQTAIAEMIDELKISEGTEGIKVDGSFHQHGPQIQWGNYGLAYLANMVRWGNLLSGTRFAFPSEKIAILNWLVKDGFSWQLRNGKMDLQAQGRQLWANSQDEKGRWLLRIIHELGGISPEFVSEGEAIAAGTIPRGCRYFWCSDFLMQQTDSYSASLRMNSVRTAPVEDYVNSDNALGRYFSDGTLLISVTGNEYQAALPCWNWTRIPGTTLPQRPFFTQKESRKHNLKIAGSYPEFTHSRRWRYRGESLFTGGVSDGNNAAAVYSQNLDGVRALKAYFFSPGWVVCLGSSICSNSALEVETTVNQTLRQGEVLTRDGMVWHDGVAYYGRTLQWETGIREGNWQYVTGRFNTPQLTRQDIFCLTIPHGKNPTDVSYEYIIHPGVSFEGAPEKPPVKIIANTADLQAVEFPDGDIAAIFHSPGELGTFKTLTPGIFLIGPKKIHAADPTARMRYLQLIDGKNNRIRTIELPQGQQAGRTITINKETER